MSKPFNKLNFSLPFSMDTAVPVDYNGYFTTYNEASAAAAVAEPAGSKDSIYYFGQIVTVVENGQSSLYQIGNDRLLHAVPHGEDVIHATKVGGAYSVEAQSIGVRTEAAVSDGTETKTGILANGYVGVDYRKVPSDPSGDTVEESTYIRKADIQHSSGEDTFTYGLPSTSDTLAVRSDIGVMAYTDHDTYEVGDLAVYDGAVWKCTVAQPSPSGNPTTDNWERLYELEQVKTNMDALSSIEGKIPSQTWSEGNELADKDFVNSSIATNTATFRGTYNLVDDLSGSVTDTYEEIGLALFTYLSSHDILQENNDYCFIQVPIADADDPSTPEDETKDIAYTDRYKCSISDSVTAWDYEYTLNNSGYTANQWAAINSGVTSGDVEKLSGIESGAEVNVIETVKVNGTALTPENKAVNVTVPIAATLDLPVIAGTAAVGLSDKFAREDHVHPAETEALTGFALPSDCFPVTYRYSNTDYEIASNDGLLFKDAATVVEMYRYEQSAPGGYGTLISTFDSDTLRFASAVYVSNLRFDNTEPSANISPSVERLETVYVRDVEVAAASGLESLSSEVYSRNTVEIDGTAVADPTVSAVKANYPFTKTYSPVHDKVVAGQQYTRAGFCFNINNYLSTVGYVLPTQTIYNYATATIGKLDMHISRSSSTTAYLLVRERGITTEVMRSNDFTIGTSEANITITFPGSFNLPVDKSYDFWFMDANGSSALSDVVIYIDNSYNVNGFEVIAGTGSRYAPTGQFFRGSSSITVNEVYNLPLEKEMEAQEVDTSLCDLNKSYVRWSETLSDADQAGGHNVIYLRPSGFGATADCTIRSFTIKTSSNTAFIPNSVVYAKIVDSVGGADVDMAVSRPVFMGAALTEYTFIFDEEVELTYTKQYRIVFVSGIDSGAVPVNVAIRLSAAQSSTQDIYFSPFPTRRPIMSFLYSDAAPFVPNRSVSEWSDSTTYSLNSNQYSTIFFYPRAFGMADGDYIKTFSITTTDAQVYGSRVVLSLMSMDSDHPIATSNDVRVTAQDTEFTFTFPTAYGIEANTQYRLRFFDYNNGSIVSFMLKYAEVSSPDMYLGENNTTCRPKVRMSYGSVMPEKLNTEAAAPAFTAKSYVLGEVCSYNGSLYRCISEYTATASSAKPVADSVHWTPTKVVKVLDNKTFDFSANFDIIAATSAAARAMGATVNNDPTVGNGGNGEPVPIAVKLDAVSIAPLFSTSSTYAVGDYVTQSGRLYRCTVAITVAGPWTGSTNWAEATLQAQIGDIAAVLHTINYGS